MPRRAIGFLVCFLGAFLGGADADFGLFSPASSPPASDDSAESQPQSSSLASVDSNPGGGPSSSAQQQQILDDASSRLHKAGEQAEERMKKRAAQEEARIDQAEKKEHQEEAKVRTKEGHRREGIEKKYKAEVAHAHKEHAEAAQKAQKILPDDQTHLVKGKLVANNASDAKLLQKADHLREKASLKEKDALARAEDNNERAMARMKDEHSREDARMADNERRQVERNKDSEVRRGKESGKERSAAEREEIHKAAKDIAKEARKQAKKLGDGASSEKDTNKKVAELLDRIESKLDKLLEVTNSPEQDRKAEPETLLAQQPRQSSSLQTLVGFGLQTMIIAGIMFSVVLVAVSKFSAARRQVPLISAEGVTERLI